VIHDYFLQQVLAETAPNIWVQLQENSLVIPFPYGKDYISWWYLMMYNEECPTKLKLINLIS
jgi:hypothetical protein